MVMREDLKRCLLEQTAVSVEVGGKALGLGRAKAYAAVRDGQIPSLRFGKRISIPTAPLRKMLGIETEAV
jgi:hypothetical protein